MMPVRPTAASRHDHQQAAATNPLWRVLSLGACSIAAGAGVELRSEPGLVIPPRSAGAQSDAPRISSMLSAIQRHPAAGPQGDADEREAADTADKVMHSAEPTPRRVPAERDADSAASAATPPRTHPLDCGEAALRHATDTLGPHAGFDFSGVRIRSDAHAARRADELGALAYTAGNEIGFASGAYAPSTPFGRGLLAHELTHVVQKARGRDAHDTPRCAAAVSAARFSVASAPTTSMAVAPSFIAGKWWIDLKTDAPGLTLDSAVNVNCDSAGAAGYEVGIVQVETNEFSEATYFGLTPADGSLVARKSQLRAPAGPCMDARTGAFWTADAASEKSLKPPACGANVALPVFSDRPSESYPGWMENGLTHKPNYVRDVKMAMAFVDALAVKTPTANVKVLKWLKWGVDWAGKFSSNAAGSKPVGITAGGGFWSFGDDSIRPTEVPAIYAAPSKTCVEIAGEATSSDYVVETKTGWD